MSLPDPQPLGEADLPVPSLSLRARALTWIARDRATAIAVPVAGALGHVASRILLRVHHRTGLRSLMASQRYSPSTSKTAVLGRSLEGAREVLFDLIPDDVELEQAARRSIVLSPPRRAGGRVAPGVLLIKFTETLHYFAHHVDIDSLQQYFRLVIEPSWAGYALPELLFFHEAGHPVLVEASEVTDREMLAQLGGALVPIALGSGEWVDYHIFHPLDLDRRYGAAYVANYTPAKRVPAFLRTVKQLKEAGHDFTVALVCADWGDRRETVLSFIHWYRIGDSVDVYENLTQTELNRVLNRSQCNVLMSLKEGSNRSLFEAMFADIPGIVLAENVGVNKLRFTAESGRVVAEAELPNALLEVSRRPEQFSPRAWAMDNISPEASTRRLRDALDRIFPQDAPHDALLVKANTPEATYFDEDLRSEQWSISRAVLSEFRKNGKEACIARILAAVEPIT